MTEEQKQALIAKCRNEIKRYRHLIETFDPNEGEEIDEYEETIRDWGEVVAVNSLALDALTAQPVACKKRLVNHRSGVAHHWTYHGEVDRPSSGDIFRVEVVPLYEHPAPAADLAELVPDEKPADSSDGNDTEAWLDEGWNACRAEVLRKIEDKKNV